MSRSATTNLPDPNQRSIAMRNTFKLLVVGLGLLATGATAQETATPDTGSPMPGTASGQGMMGQAFYRGTTR